SPGGLLVVGERLAAPPLRPDPPEVLFGTVTPSRTKSPVLKFVPKVLGSGSVGAHGSVGRHRLFLSFLRSFASRRFCRSWLAGKRASTECRSAPHFSSQLSTHRVEPKRPLGVRPCPSALRPAGRRTAS